MSLSAAVLEAVGASEDDAQACANDELAWTSAPDTIQSFLHSMILLPFHIKIIKGFFFSDHFLLSPLLVLYLFPAFLLPMRYFLFCESIWKELPSF